MFNTAFNLHSQGKLEEAEKIYKEILTNEPKNAQVLNLLGLIKISQNNLDEAEKLITEALSIKKDAYFYENLARVYEYKKDYETEIKVLEKRAKMLIVDLRFILSLRLHTKKILNMKKLKKLT